MRSLNAEGGRRLRRTTSDLANESDEGILPPIKPKPPPAVASDILRSVLNAEDDEEILEYEYVDEADEVEEDGDDIDSDVDAEYEYEEDEA